jgi:hypothetical protein
VQLGTGESRLPDQHTPTVRSLDMNSQSVQLQCVVLVAYPGFQWLCCVVQSIVPCSLVAALDAEGRQACAECCAVFADCGPGCGGPSVLAVRMIVACFMECGAPVRDHTVEVCWRRWCGGGANGWPGYFLWELVGALNVQGHQSFGVQ